MIRPLNGLRALVVLAFAFALLATQVARAFEIEEIEARNGVTGWLVEDYTNPIITIAASFDGGAVQDPAGKEGMASLMSSLFDEGAGPYDARAFQARLDKLGIQLRYSDRRDRFTMVLQTLRDDREDAFEMLRLSLTDLHFEEDSINRMRNALKANIVRREQRPQSRAGQALRGSLFGKHPYSRSSDGTVEGLDNIDRVDLVAHFKRLFARDNLKIGIVGAIDRQEAIDMLDAVFADLPATASLVEVDAAEPNFGERIEITDPSPQTTISIALPGVSRDSDRFFAAYLMNHILGGGTFSSRLYNEVREKRGLAYSVYSSLTNYERASFLSVGTATAAERADEALSVIKGEIEKMASNGPSEAELEAAKRYVIGAYAINNLDTSSNIARALVAMQEEDLGINYLQERERLINAVSVEDVRKIARELLSAEPTIVVVGPSKS